jgi:hypothetical protein
MLPNERPPRQLGAHGSDRALGTAERGRRIRPAPFAGSSRRSGRSDPRTGWLRRVALAAGVALGGALLLGLTAGLAAPGRCPALLRVPPGREFHLVGHVVSIDDPDRLLDGSVSEGSMLAADYTFDPATPDEEPDPAVGVYPQRAAPAGVRVEVGHYTFESAPADNFGLRIQIFHQPPDPDVYEVISHDNLPLSDGLSVREIFWHLADEQGTTLASDALPVAPPDLTRFTALNRLFLAGEGEFPKSYLIAAVIDQVDAVPAEPAPPGQEQASPTP